MIHPWDQYCEDVFSGKIPSGIHVIYAIDRYQSDLKRADLDFRPEKVEHVTEIIGTLRHFKGIHDGVPFTLSGWESFIIANLFGFYWKNTDLRRFQNAYIEVARKNGKTALVSAISFYGLVGDDEAAAEILIAANSKEQAKICFDTVRGFIHKFDPNEKYLKRFRADILYPSTNSFIKVLAADSDKMDGFNPSVGIIDEYHSAPDSSVRDVIKSGMGMRKNPLMITITTAGFDKSKPCYELRTTATEIISGVKIDDSFFSVIFSLDEGDDWKDPKNWIKANPNLGITVSESFLGNQVVQAINNPAEETGVKTKNLNLWCDSASVWIPDDFIIKASKKVDRSIFKDEICYVGADLSSNVDLAAVSYLFIRDEFYYFFTDFYLPNESLKTRADKELYKTWKNQGYLNVTAGNVCDYNYITADLKKYYDLFDFKNIRYDKWNATQWAIQCTDEGFPMEPFGQAIPNFNGCTKEFERLMLKGSIILDDNPIMRFCLRNVEIRRDHNGNEKPDQVSDKKKIDGVIAALMALSVYMDYPGGGGNIY